MPKFISLLLLLLTVTTPVLAGSPVGFPPVLCDDTVTGEFHPLRPYPGTPCNLTIPLDTPIFCGTGSFSREVDVPATCGGKQECTFTRDVEYDVFVDLTQVRIPILGNTQDDLDEATQVNNYLNWYLNGTVQQSEQPGFFSPTDPDRLVNFAGPIKKLLPQSIQEKIREDVTKPQYVGNDYHNYLIGQGALGPERLQSFWKTLLLNIPFSSYEDSVGKVSFSAPDSQPDGVGSVSLTVTPTKGDVFVPHLKSLDVLSSLVTNFYQPYSPTGPIPVVPTTSGLCTITKAYTLPTGDSLLGPKMKLHLKYTQEFKYDADTSPSPPPTLSRPSTVSINTNSQTPLIDNIFWNLVGSPQSPTRRFAPQTSQIKDGNSAIPAAATDPAGHEVLFAKIGSLFDHILGGALENINLQRLLRPKDISRPAQPSTSICSSQCNPDPANVTMTNVKKKFSQLATGWFGEESRGQANPRLDKFDLVVSRAQNAGLDPIFVLAEWLYEGSASNYRGICQNLGGGDPTSDYCRQVQDFGINKSSITTKINKNGRVVEDHFDDQLAAFLNLPRFYLDQCTVSSSSCVMETWGAMFRYGDCSPTDASNGYISRVLDTYREIAPAGQPVPCYPIKSSP